jgi:hypothetical protein
MYKHRLCKTVHKHMTPTTSGLTNFLCSLPMRFPKSSSLNKEFIRGPAMSNSNRVNWILGVTNLTSRIVRADGGAEKKVPRLRRPRVGAKFWENRSQFPIVKLRSTPVYSSPTNSYHMKIRVCARSSQAENVPIWSKLLTHCKLYAQDILYGVCAESVKTPVAVPLVGTASYILTQNWPITLPPEVISRPYSWC